MTNNEITIATRGSELALWQANHVRDRLMAHRPGLRVELLILKTQGDKILDVPLAKIGGKALFVKEIEQALLDRRADVAVHSMKDVPTELAPGLVMSAVSEREDPNDALCTRDGRKLADLPDGAIVGTSSMRRTCQLKRFNGSFEIRMLRGNVPTRLAKLDAGDYDAIVLAAAGLKRLGFGNRISERLSASVSLPAVGQGALGIETRDGDDDTSTLVREALHHERDAKRVLAERAFLNQLEGGCQTPIAAHAYYERDELVFDGLVGRPDGSEILTASRRGAPSEGQEMAVSVAKELLGRGAAKILADCIAAAENA